MLAECCFAALSVSVDGFAGHLRKLEVADCQVSRERSDLFDIV